jgi:hypothetical protein
MDPTTPQPDQPSRDYFISYTGVDETWAEWIAWQLEESGYITVLQCWDFGAGAHFVTEMHEATLIARRTIAVLSNAYVQSAFAQAEWQEAWRQDPTGVDRRLLVFRIEDCPRPGLLGQVVSVDLFGIDEQTAKSRLLDAVKQRRRKPALPPGFPGQDAPAEKPEFPGILVPSNLEKAIASGGPLTPENPWAVAIAFWNVATEGDYAQLEDLITPESQGQWDLADIKRRTENSGIVSGVYRPVFDVAHVRLIADLRDHVTDPNDQMDTLTVSGPMQAQAWIISLVYRPELGGWRVHGFGRSLAPDELPRTYTEVISAN